VDLEKGKGGGSAAVGVGVAGSTAASRVSFFIYLFIGGRADLCMAFMKGEKNETATS
jgi:hypothetical protein